MTLPPALVGVVQAVYRGRMSDPVLELQRAEVLEDVHRILRTAARRLTRADGATFVLLDGDRCYYADEDSMSPLWKGQRFPASSCISGWAMHHRATVAIRDIRVDPRIPQEAYRPTFVRSLVVTPILDPEAIGALGAYWATLHTATPAEVSALEDLAAAAAPALARFPEGIPSRDFTT
ncbi:GAF domain-containing protein [Saccharothrix variisporea]|uniref:GAF domain-containing protein n=2 Tax=Saccharothrix variisporea TaxID=543527 RepID=A0A495XFE3_9PSEU|nr:GAF domain-containing protein [Saccharothrix variisporea]